MLCFWPLCKVLWWEQQVRKLFTIEVNALNHSTWLPVHLASLLVWLRRECMSLYHFSWLCTQVCSPKLLSESQMTIICSSFSSRVEERAKPMSACENRQAPAKAATRKGKGWRFFFSSKLSFSQTTITPYFSSGNADSSARELLERSGKSPSTRKVTHRGKKNDFHKPL